MLPRTPLTAPEIADPIRKGKVLPHVPLISGIIEPLFGGVLGEPGGQLAPLVGNEGSLIPNIPASKG